MLAPRACPARPARIAALVAAALSVACAGSRRAPSRPRAPLPTAPVVEQVPQEPRPVVDYGPEVLLPDPAGTDAEVARVGDLVLRRSQAFARLLAAEPRLALDAIDLLVFDVLIAQHARQFGIALPPGRVRELADREEQQLKEQLTREFRDQLTLDDYVWRTLGMHLPAWRRTLELRAAQRLFQGYVIRYLALREDRVLARYAVNKDRAVLAEMADKVRQGADFATLAQRLTESTDGGLLPPIGKGFPHPVAEAALALQPGELSPVFERTVGGSNRCYLVYCLQRLAGRDVTFADVRDEIDQDLATKPLSQLEMNAYTLRWRGAVEAKTDDKPPPGR